MPALWSTEIMSVVLGFASSDEIVFVGLGFGARGATIKESRRNTGDNDDQNASHASSPVLSNDTQSVLSTERAHKGASGYSRQPLFRLDSRSCSALASASLMVPH